MNQKAQSSFINGPAGALEIRLSLPGAKLDEKLRKKGQNDQAWVVISHPHPQFGGTMNNKVVTTLEKSFQALGYGTLVYNFRGVEGSEGSYDNAEGEQQDLLSVVNWLKQSYFVDQLILAGFSFGSYISAKQHGMLQADRLCLVAPPVNLYDFSEIQLSNKPVTLIQGGQDEVVPAEEVKDWWWQQQALPHNGQHFDLFWRANASHFFHKQLIWLKQIILMAY